MTAEADRLSHTLRHHRQRACQVQRLDEARDTARALLVEDAAPAA